MSSISVLYATFAMFFVNIIAMMLFTTIIKKLSPSFIKNANQNVNKLSMSGNALYVILSTLLFFGFVTMGIGKEYTQ